MAKKNEKELKQEVHEAVEEAADKSEIGNVATVKETSKQPGESLPTGTRRSHPAE